MRENNVDTLRGDFKRGRLNLFYSLLSFLLFLTFSIILLLSFAYFSHFFTMSGPSVLTPLYTLLQTGPHIANRKSLIKSPRRQQI